MTSKVGGDGVGVSFGSFLKIKTDGNAVLLSAIAQ
jgi:hypothetical protein